MRRLLGCLTALFLLATFARYVSITTAEPPVIAPTEPRTPAEEQKALKVPPGFVVELVAAEPDIHKPINMNFDAQGRLWITESVEYPFPAAQGKKPRDAVKVLEFANGAAKATKISTFGGELNIPIGVLPISKGVIVHSIPNVWQLVDTQSAGHSDKRDVLFGAVGFNDTHGMTGNFTWGFDGYIYATHGFSNTSTLKGSDGSQIRMHSGNTYRFRPDGSKLEQYTWGQVNPFGLAFDSLGNLFSADCHTKPIMQLLRGGYYDSFGKPHDGLGYAPEICGNYPDSTAVCGIAIYEADHFPQELRGTAFIGDVVTSHIINYKLENHGATRKAVRLPDFLKSDDPWFRPVDIKLGPDGCLYVADFYNRIIGHYEVPLNHPGRDRERGRIWRISYQGPNKEQKPGALPDLTRSTVPQLVESLGHSNLTVRLFATNLLVERGKLESAEAVSAARSSSKPLQRSHALWVLERLEGIKVSDETLAKAATDSDAGVRAHAMHVLAERKELNPRLGEMARAGLRDADGFVQRAAADALGRHPDPGNVRPLLERRAKVPADDSQLSHTVRMALRNQFLSPASWDKRPEPWTEADARALADVAPGIHTLHAGAFLLGHIQQYPESGERLIRYVRHSARYAPEEQVASAVKFLRGNKPDDVRLQANLLRAVQQGTQERGGKLSSEAGAWAGDLTGKLLAAKENDLLQLGVDLANALKQESTQPALTALVKRKDAAEKVRQSAMQALASIQPKAHVGLLAGVLVDAGDAMPVREHAANVLAGINQSESREQLVKALPTAPARLQSVIASGLAGSAQGAEQLLDAVTTGKASARLLQERPVEVKLSQAKVPNLKERVAKLTAGLPPAEQRLQEIINKRRVAFSKAKTDIEAGAKVFEKSCANCHQLANKGAKVGPQLDGVGIRGLDRLLEDIIDPNRNVDQAFRASTIVTKKGQIVTGLVLREEGEVVVVADQQGKEVRLEKKEIEERTVSQLSPMPANLVDQIPESDFYHLLAFLLNQRTPPAK
jgi:putative heme-binding domain-containing protein